jgi:hypothetical protein
MVSDMVCSYSGIAAGLLIAWFISRKLNIFTFVTTLAFVAGVAFCFVAGLFFAAFSGHDFGYLPGIIGVLFWVVISCRTSSASCESLPQTRHS